MKALYLLAILSLTLVAPSLARDLTATTVPGLWRGQPDVGQPPLPLLQMGACQTYQVRVTHRGSMEGVIAEAPQHAVLPVGTRVQLWGEYISPALGYAITYWWLPGPPPRIH